MSPSAASAKKARPSIPRRASSKQELATAFQTFTNAAGSLERSYSHLQAEVLRLGFELERTNPDLSASPEENANMRLKPREYVLRLRGVELARGETYQDWLLAISSEAAPPPLTMQRLGQGETL